MRGYEKVTKMPLLQGVLQTCLSGTSDLLVWHKNGMVLLGGKSARPRRIATQRLTNIVNLGVLQIGKNEVVAVVRDSNEKGKRRIRVELYRYDPSGRFGRRYSQEVFSIDEREVAKINAKLSSINLLLDISFEAGELRLGGLLEFMTGEIKEIGVMLPKSFRVDPNLLGAKNRKDPKKREGKDNPPEGKQEGNPTKAGKNE